MNDCVLRFDTEKAKGRPIHFIAFTIFLYSAVWFFIYYLFENAAACTDILAALNQPVNAERLARAKEISGTDMVKVMREVFPIVTEIQLEVRAYAYSCINLKNQNLWWFDR